MDPAKHDPLRQNREESEEMNEETEEITDTDEVRPAEEIAVHSDTESAAEASAEVGGGVSDDSVESGELADAEPTDADSEAADEDGEPSDSPDANAAATTEEPATDRKHKNRESTSEKAKRAAAERRERGVTVSESGAAVKRDPLRLRGKKYRAVVAKVEKTKLYPVEEAIALVKETSTSTFDGAVELHAKLKGESVRGTVSLPNGTGKTKKVAIADDDTIAAIAAGSLDFEVLLATPAQMPKLAKYAKLLGPKGLMPSPKAGTVSDDLESTKAEIEKGRVEYRADKGGVVHLSIGRLSFTNEQLLENYRVIEQLLTSHKILSLSLAPTMGPGVRVALEG